MWILCCLLVFFYLSEAKEEGKIVGGNPIPISKAPYQISFRFKNQHFCGGCIYKEEWIITAAHCIADFQGPTDLTVVAGQTHLSDSDGQTVAVDKLIPHPNYDSGSVDYDIALLHLAEPLIFNDNVHNFALANTSLKAGSTVFVTGWGTTRRGGGGEISDQLMGVEVRVQNWLSCQLQYFLQLTKRMFCAGNYFGGQDSCQGDSGGPATHGNTLVGIVSFGRGCGDFAAPGVYTQISSVMDFIRVSVTDSS